MCVLGRVIRLRRQLRGMRRCLKRRELEQELFALLDEYIPIGSAERLQVAGERLIMPFTLDRDQRQRQRVYTPWKNLTVGRLRLSVASATRINDREISARALSVEKRAIRDILECLMALDRGVDGMIDADAAKTNQDAVDRLFKKRLFRQNELLRVAVDVESDRLRVFGVPDSSDLGLLNTKLLLDLFDSFPVLSLARCKLESCGRYFIPGAEGRRRTVGIKFCGDACKRAWTNLRQRGEL